MKRLVAFLLVCAFCFNTLNVQAAVPTYHADGSQQDAPALGKGKSYVYLDEMYGYFKYTAKEAGTYTIKISDVKCTESTCKDYHSPMASWEATGYRYKKEKNYEVMVNYGNPAKDLNIGDGKKIAFTCKMKKGDTVYISMGYYETCKFTVNISKKK